MIFPQCFYVKVVLFTCATGLLLSCSEPMKPYTEDGQRKVCIDEFEVGVPFKDGCNGLLLSMLTVDRSNPNHQVMIQLDAADEQPGDLDPASCPTLSKFRPGETYYFRIVKEEHRYFSQEQIWNPEQAVRRPD